MKKFARVMSIVIALMTTITLLSGCNQMVQSDNSKQGNTQDSGPTETTKPKNVELRFAWWGSDDRHEAYIAAMNKYMELNTHVKIIAEYGGWDGYKEKLYTQLASGNAPHIFQNHYTWLPEQAVWDSSMVMKDLYQYKDIFDMSIFPEDFLKQYVVYDGKLLAIPSSINSDVVVANKKLFDEAGIEYDKDWTLEDFFEANKKLKAINPEYYFENGMAAADIHMYWFLAYLVQKTGLPYTTDYQLSYDEATLIEAFQFIERYFEEGVVEPLGTLELYSGKYSQNPKWIKGESAISFGMLSTIEATVNALGDYADYATVIKLPVMKDAKDPYYQMKVGQIFSIPNSVGEAEAAEAAKFLAWSVTDTEAGLLLKLSRGIPISEVQMQALSDAGLISPLATQAMNYAKEIGQGIGQDALIRNNEIAEIGADMISKVAFGMITPEEAAKQYKELINKKLLEIKDLQAQ